jgi:hypothetical protein
MREREVHHTLVTSPCNKVTIHDSDSFRFFMLYIKSHSNVHSVVLAKLPKKTPQHDKFRPMFSETQTGSVFHNVHKDERVDLNFHHKKKKLEQGN